MEGQATKSGNACRRQRVLLMNRLRSQQMYKWTYILAAFASVWQVRDPTSTPSSLLFADGRAYNQEAN